MQNGRAGNGEAQNDKRASQSNRTKCHSPGSRTSGRTCQDEPGAVPRL